MKIVILDGYPITQKDLSWNSLCQFGEVTAYDRTPYEEQVVMERIGDAQLVLTSKVPITDRVMEQCPNMKYIGVTATGYNIIDVEAAARRGVTVTNVPGYGTETVAEFVFALLLHLTRQVSVFADSVQQGDWCRCEDFCYFPANQVSLSGKKMGIIGFGQIGRKTAEIAQAFGMKTLVFTGYPDKTIESEKLRFVTLEELLKQSDVVSLHCPLTEDRTHMMNEEAFRMMKPEAYLINTSRGALVEEEALAKALREGWIKGAAVDVIEQEPMREDCPLRGVPGCVIVPHVAWATKECRELLIQILGDNIREYLNGTPIHVVS